MAGCVYQVKFILLAILARVGQGHCLTFDGDAPFPFDIHVVEYLVAELPVVHQVGVLDQAVGKR